MSGRDCEADGTDVHKVHPNTRIHSHSTHRYKFVAVGTVCGVGDDYTDPTNYKLVKLPKINQDRRIDMPTLGLTTIENASLAGLAGIAFAGEETQLIDADACIKRADELGMFLKGLKP